MRLRTTLRLAAGTALLLVATLLGVAGPASSAGTTVTSFSFTSQTGDYIGQGQGRSYDPTNATFSVQGTAGYLTVWIRTVAESWSVDLAAPSGSQLAPGTYPNATRAAFSGAAAGLDVSGAGRGCNTLTGSFTINALSSDSHGQVTVLDAAFTQHCEGVAAALQGSVRYSAPTGSVELTSSSTTVVEGQSFVLAATVLPGTTSSVTFRDGSTVLGTSSAANGLATWRVDSVTPGTHSYTAAQGTSAVSQAVTETVLPGSTSMFFRSPRGDYIGQGATSAFAAPSATITVGGTASGLTVGVSEGSEWWYVQLAPVTGQTLTTGSYPMAERASSRSAGHPGLDVYGDGRGCNSVTGSFAISRIAFAPDGSVSVLDATWSQNCEGGSTAMTGRVHVNAPIVQPTTTSLAVTTKGTLKVGKPVSTVVTVAGAGATPTGTVALLDGGSQVGTATLSGGTAAMTWTPSVKGTHTLTASYAGDGTHQPSTSAPVTVKVG